MSSVPERLVVLSITAKFPNVVQPWLVNQLLEIARNGGANRVLARNAQLDIVSSDVRDNGLLDVCDWVPNTGRQLLADWLTSFFRPQTALSAWRGLGRFPRVLRSRVLSWREKLYGLLLCRFYGDNDIDIVHSHSEAAGSKLLPIVIGLDVPLVATFHGLMPDGVPELSDARRKAYATAAHVLLVNTEAAKAQYVALGAPAEKIRIVPQGIPLSGFRFRLRRPPEDGLVDVLSVGRLDVSKGQEYTIRAVHQLREQGRSVRLHLVGLGPAEQSLRSLVANLGLEKSVVFHGLMVDDALRAVFDQCQILVLASLSADETRWQETQGVVLQEAQASGLLVIATRTGGIPECVAENESALLVEDRSAEQIAGAITTLIDDPDRWEAWQTHGRAWVERRFSSLQVGKQMYALYANTVTLAGRKPLQA